MRKTFLKVALIGLLVGSLPVGFTSCKDYDDDIEQTNNQVADLKTKLASVETAIAALPSKADVTAAQAAAVAQAKADLEAVKAELQKAIDGKADKEAVEAINTELNSIKGQLETIEALKGQVSAAVEAINGSIAELKADAVTKGQMIAGLEAQIAELKEAQGEGATNVAALTEELNTLKTAVNDPENGIEALKKQIAALAEKIDTENPGSATSLEAVLRVVNGMITHIEVVTTGDNAFDTSLALYNVTVAETRTFGDEGKTFATMAMGSRANGYYMTVANPVEFKAGEQLRMSDKLLIRVSPANAVVSATDQIQLVNTKGEDLSKYIQIDSVRPYTGLLTQKGSRSVSTNGLHEVYFSLLKEFDGNAFNAATNAGKPWDPNYVKWAVAVADSEDALAEGRTITSAYDVIVESQPGAQQNALNFKVNNKDVDQIRNRYTYAWDGMTTPGSTDILTSYMYQKSQVNAANTYSTLTGYMDAIYGHSAIQADYRKANSNGFAPVGDFAWTIRNNTRAAAAQADNRTAQDLYRVEKGQAFNVNLTGYTQGNRVYGFYVTLDLLRATESGETERSGWLAIAPKIAGLNTITRSNDIDLTIAADADIVPGDVIGFRVYAVNFDGSLVDPDGRAFYVQVGNAADIDVPAADLTPLTIVANTATSAKGTVSGLDFDMLNDYPQINVKLTCTDYHNPFMPNNLVVSTKNGDSDGYNVTASGITLDRGSDGKNYATQLGKLKVALGAVQTPKVTPTYSTTSPSVLTGYTWNGTSFNPASVYGYIDDMTYTATLTITNATNGLPLQKINIAVVKTVNSSMPTGFGLKPGFADPIKAVVTESSAEFALNGIFNWGTGLTIASPGYAAYQPTLGNWWAPAVIASNYKLALADKKIDNKYIINGVSSTKLNLYYEYPNEISYALQTMDDSGNDASIYRVNVASGDWKGTWNVYKLDNAVASDSYDISFMTIPALFKLEPVESDFVNFTTVTYGAKMVLPLDSVMVTNDYTATGDFKNLTLTKALGLGTPAPATTYMNVAKDTNIDWTSSFNNPAGATDAAGTTSKIYISGGLATYYDLKYVANATYPTLVPDSNADGTPKVDKDGNPVMVPGTTTGKAFVLEPKSGTAIPQAAVTGNVVIRYYDNITGTGIISKSLPTITMNK